MLKNYANTTKHNNFLGRVLAGWLSDYPFIDALFVTNVAVFLGGLSVIAMPLCSTYGLFVAISLAFGLCVAAFISLTSIVLVDLVGLDDLTSAFGLLNLFRYPLYIETNFMP